MLCLCFLDVHFARYTGCVQVEEQLRCQAVDVWLSALRLKGGTQENMKGGEGDWCQKGGLEDEGLRRGRGIVAVAMQTNTFASSSVLCLSQP